MFITRGVLKGDGYRIGGGISPYLSHPPSLRQDAYSTRRLQEPPLRAPRDVVILHYFFEPTRARRAPAAAGPGTHPKKQAAARSRRSATLRALPRDGPRCGRRTPTTRSSSTRAGASRAACCSCTRRAVGRAGRGRRARAAPAQLVQQRAACSCNRRHATRRRASTSCVWSVCAARSAAHPSVRRAKSQSVASVPPPVFLDGSPVRLPPAPAGRASARKNNVKSPRREEPSEAVPGDAVCCRRPDGGKGGAINRAKYPPLSYTHHPSTRHA